MKKTKVISLVLALAMSTSLMTGCYNDTNAVVSDTSESVVAENTDNKVVDNSEILKETEPLVVDSTTNRVDAYEEIPETKVYGPYEHVFMVRYDLADEAGFTSARNISGASINVPEGYEILDVENFNALGSKIGTNQTYGVDVWFVNKDTVEVAPVWNKGFQSYDYSQPGKVVELSQDNSEQVKTK